MREFEVLQNFTTVNRRLKTGDVIDESLDVSPHSFETLFKRKVVMEKKSDAPIADVFADPKPSGEGKPGRAAPAVTEF